MSPFADRMALGRPHEDEVRRSLEVRGWHAYPFGQAQIPEAAREILRRYQDDALRPTLLRWMPDIIALRDDDPPRVVLIDAKAGNGKRFAIETRSVEAAERFVGEFHVPVFFVCAGGLVLTPRDVRERGWLGPVNERTGGSHTPYFLVEKCWGRVFSEVFGSPPQAAAA